MRTITLRTLVREPIKVKRWTAAGQAVRVTDNGRPLWTIHPAVTAEDATRRAQAIDELLEEMLREPRSRVSAVRLLEDSRR